jgi:KDO2-lipid IV(A) lauroyltransferase
VVTAFIERRGDGGHLVRVAPVPVGSRRGRDGVRELTARLTAAIEAQIRRSPAEWVWWHERWRRQPHASAS